MSAMSCGRLLCLRWLWVGVVLGGCTDLGIDDVLYPCTSDETCGEGFSCVAGICRAGGVVPPDDTSSSDTTTSPQDGTDPDTNPDTPLSCNCSVGQVSVRAQGGVCACMSIKEVVLGGAHTCARLQGLDDAQQLHQAVYCWGDDAKNQADPNVSATTPVLLPTRVDVGDGEPIALCAGQAHTCALIDLGADARALRCWGDNSRSQLSHASQSERVGSLNVYAIPGLDPDIRLIACGRAHTCALVGETQVFCWGDNENKQIGTDAGGVVASPSPVASPIFETGGLSALVSGNDHTCALYNSGLDIGCWGLNADSQLGRLEGQTNAAPQNVALDVDSDGSPSNISQVSTGLAHTCLRGGSSLDQGSIYCWGANALNQLGVGSNTPSLASPTSLTRLKLDAPIQGAVSLSVGDHFSCAVIEYGEDFRRELYCWGDNTSGQISDTPGTIEYATKIGNGSVTGFAYVVAGGQHACALQDTLKSLYCWGNNTLGQVGIGTTSPRADLTPVLVP